MMWWVWPDLSCRVCVSTFWFPATDPEFQAAVTTLVDDLTAARALLDGVDTPTFDELISPVLAPPEAGLISADGTTVQVVGNVPGERPVGASMLAPVRRVLAD